MEQKELLVEGQSKQIFQSGDADKIIVHYKDTATAYNEIKIANIANKGIINNQISAIIYRQLEQAGIKTHFIKALNKRDQLCLKVDIIPVEVIVRNVIAGSMSKRLGIPEGTKPSNVIYDLCYKNKQLGDPLINDHQAVALGLVTYPELEYMHGQTKRINEVLEELFARIRITLVDFKIEFFTSSAGAFFVYGLAIAIFNAVYSKIENMRRSKTFALRIMPKPDVSAPDNLDPEESEKAQAATQETAKEVK